MKILVINSGSSSLKFQLFEHHSGAAGEAAIKKHAAENKNNANNQFHLICKGVIDGIGLPTCQFKMTAGKSSKKNQAAAIQKNILCKNHHQALDLALQAMVKEQVITSLKIIDAIGHRVVHGGEKYHQAVLITPQVMTTIDKLSELAPLHNPPNLRGIEACAKLLKDVPQVAVFDTSFHTSIPEKAFLYALPYELYSKEGIRRYGFHGTSHEYVSGEAIKLLQKTGRPGGSKKHSQKRQQKDSKIVSCHLGNGSSVTAIINGKSMDTSMGLTPHEGIPMGTRSGDIDPDIIFHLLKLHHQTPDQIENMLLKQSGLKGISGISSDMRDLWAAVKKTGRGAGAPAEKKLRAKLTLQILSYRIAKYIGSYAAAMNGLDAIIFTAGIGEQAYYIRQEVCSYLTHLGVQLDLKKNKKNAVVVNSTKSKIKVFVIPTNEEAQIAKETLKILRK